MDPVDSIYPIVLSTVVGSPSFLGIVVLVVHVLLDCIFGSTRFIGGLAAFSGSVVARCF